MERHIGLTLTGVIVILTLLIYIIVRIIVFKRRADSWDIIIFKRYSDFATQIDYPEHRQRVWQWLLDSHTKMAYIDNPKGFHNLYEEKVEQIGVEITKKLTQKYKDEYKSRNKKDTETI